MAREQEPRPWRAHGERVVYDSPWVRLCVADVERPSGVRHEYHLVRVPDSVGMVLLDDLGRVLLTWRHRFIVGRWGWELPAGRIDVGEDVLEAGMREVLEETGYRARDVRLLCSTDRCPGFSDERSHVLVGRADGTGDAGPDADEAPRMRWHDRDELPALLSSGAISDAFSATGILWFLADEAQRAGA